MSGERIGPTAHYTAAVWHAHGLSPRALATPVGRALYRALEPINAAYGRSGHDNLVDMLLARHRWIDEVLIARIEAGEIGTVLELACGLSGRGLRLTERVPALRYVESDLPLMAARKRAALRRAGVEPRERHRVLDLDALAPGDLERAFASLDPSRGVAVVTEGLIPYLPLTAVTDLWRRIATGLRSFPAGLYLTDLNFTRDVGALAMAQALRRALTVLVGTAVELHFEARDDARAALSAAGFSAVELIPDGDTRRVVRIAAARV